MRRAKVTAVWLALTALTTCTRSRSAETIGPAWAVADRASVSITDSAAPPGHELNGVSSARRLPDHAILVANAGAFELALFDSTGRFQRAIGRKGRGPGEFQGPISVFAWRADSLTVYDPATLRWTILGPALATSRSIPAPNSTILQPTWLYQGAVVNDGVIDPVPGWVLAILDSLRRQDPEFGKLMHARRDDLGALWVRDSLNKGKWAVYADSGLPAATVLLPSGLEPLHIGEDFVLGIVYDSLGVEELRSYTLHRPNPYSKPRTLTSAPLPSDPAILAAFRGLLMAQEMYYSSHAKYAAQADSLRLTTPFPAHLFLLEGDARHWSAIAVHRETGATCGLSVGWPSPLGWLDGTPFCGR